MTVARDSLLFRFFFGGGGAKLGLSEEGEMDEERRGCCCPYNRGRRLNVSRAILSNVVFKRTCHRSKTAAEQCTKTNIIAA